MGFFSRLFRKTAPEPAPPVNEVPAPDRQRHEELVAALESARDVVQAYGIFMQSPDFPSVGSVADTAKLPYPKEMLKAALKICIRVTREEEHSRALRDVYIRLGDFQEGVGPRNVGFIPGEIPDIDNIGTMTDEEKLELARKATAWGDRMQEGYRFLEAAEAEKQVLAREMAVF